LCFTGIVYAADVDTMRLTFQASGSLWQDALVMQDLETQSLWSQISGECIAGPLKGQTLTLYNSFHTTYGEFKKSYPEGIVLKKPERGEAGSYYDKYFSDPEKLGIFGRIDNFQKLPAKSKVFGVRRDGKQAAVALALLETRGWAAIVIESSNIIMTYDVDGHTAAAFVLPETKDVAEVTDGVIMLSDGGRQWNAQTGKGMSAKAGDLEPVPLISAFWFAWASFFPDSEIYQ
jgi:hypothetical protein